MSSAFPAHVPPELVLDVKWYGLEDADGDPNANLAKLHGGRELFYIPKNDRNPFGTWVLTRYDDIQKVFGDTQNFTSNYISGFNVLAGVDQLLIPVELDPPDHTKYKTFLMPYFSRARILELEPVMRQGVDSVIDEIIDTGEADIVPCGYKMMAAVWCELVGAPIEKSDLYIRFLFQVIHQYDPMIRFTCAREMLDAMKDLYHTNKDKPGKGLINAFINRQVDGESPSEAECSGFILFMFLAGMDTMGSSTAWILRYLAQNPDRRHALRDNPQTISAFVEEMLRRYSVVSTNRFVKQDVVVRGVTLKKGDNILLSTPMACMDADKFECPQSVDTERTARHMAFGFGPHFCIGAAVARAQLPIMVETWLQRIPDFEVKPGVALTAHVGDVIGLDSLPLVWPVPSTTQYGKHSRRIKP